jgi:uncharacterized protein YecT (DUF1311 family)
MTKKLSISISLILSFVLFSGVASAEEGPKKDHPIDRTLELCLQKDFTTAGMVECIGRAYEMWDRELNRAYKALDRQLDAKGKASLKKAQLAWLKYRDTEFELIDSIYSKLQGTAYIPARASNRLNIVRARALELNQYLELIQQNL